MARTPITSRDFQGPRFYQQTDGASIAGGQARPVDMHCTVLSIRSLLTLNFLAILILQMLKR